jgi:hypothetical protein
MIRVLVEANDGAGRLVVEVRAGSVRRALELADEYCSRGAVNLVFPIDPDSFFVTDGVSRTELVKIVRHEERRGEGRMGA